MARLPARVASLATRAIVRPGGGEGFAAPANRIVIPVAGAHRSDAEPLRRAVCAAVQALPGVEWAVVNAPLGRLVVAVREPASGATVPPAASPAPVAATRRAPGPPLRATLTELVHGVEAEFGASRGDDSPEPPDDAGPMTRALTAVVADVAGLAMATTGRLARWVPLSAEAASLVTVVDTQPRVRALAERALGRTRADTLLALTNAVAQGLSQGHAGLVVDTALRVGQLAEVRARREAWRGWESRLADPAVAVAPPVAAERPRPLPDGPIERYAPQSARVAAAAAGTALAGGGGPRRAAAIALSTLPKAAGAGREMFAAQLGRTLARRGAQVMDRRALRRLDRVDTVVLDVPALTTGRLIVGDVVPMPDTDSEQVQFQVHALYDERALTTPVGSDGWRLGPVDRLALPAGTDVGERRRLARSGATRVLGLAHGTDLAAMVAVAPEPAQAADALVAAARRAGVSLVFTGGQPPGAREVAARRMPGGNRLLSTVRDLQAEGKAVLLVSRDAAALAGADCGIGVDHLDGSPPWGAHLLVGDDLEPAALMIDAVAAARAVSRRGVRLAEAGTALGAVATVTGRATGSAARALLAVNGAAAVSVAHGAWTASELARRPLSPPVSTTPWHLLSVDKTLASLGTGTSGLTTRDARQRHHRDTQVYPQPPSLWRAFAEELANPLTPILAGGAALSAAIGSVVDAAVVVGASAFGALVGSLQRTLTDRAVADLLAGSAVTATARRDGATVRLRADELVVGDLVSLSPGDVVAADCRLVRASGLEMDESSLTGESFPVAKSVAPVATSAIAERTCMVYEGTTVAAGRGQAVVVATGAGTEAGRSMATAQQTAPTSGVEARLAQITGVTLPIALASGVAVIGAGLLRGRPVQRTVGAGVGLAVASVPEGLPFLVSAAQLAAARRLSRQGALVRNARTIEALGRVDVLCFDKTGTLTQGRIRLASVSDGTRHATVDALDDDLRAVVSAGLRATPEPPPGQKLPHLTDRAVRRGAKDVHIGPTVSAPGWRRAAALPFEPSRGYHATAGTSQRGASLSVKGAPEVVLPRCVSWRTGHGVRDLDARSRRRLQEELHRLTGRGYRVLAVAERALEEAGQPDDDQVAQLSFLGFLALADPVRGTAGPSLDELRSAGAQIVMITGDHPNTAGAIAEELGILNGHRVVTGTEIDSLDDDALAALVPQIAVVARGTPAHKVRVVKAFQRVGRVVAMTGDGANDAPAIRLADVGIALGHRGTPAARAAADLVVTDDRLETIIAALVEGRAMWRSVREGLGILVGGNLGEIGFTLFGAALVGTSPLNARQLLLVNLLTDLAPALAIAVRPPASTASGALLAEGPERSLGTALTREVALRAAATTVGAASGWLAARATGRGARARTVALAALVATQLGQTVLLGGRSPGVLLASLGSAAALAVVIQTPGVSHFFGCTPIGPLGWGIAVAAATGTTVAAGVLPPLVGRLARARSTYREQFANSREQDKSRHGEGVPSPQATTVQA